MADTIYLVGGNGAPNFGDEVIALAWIRELSERFPKSEIVLDCNSIETPSQFLHLDRFNVRVISGIKRFASQVIRPMIKKNINKQYQFMAALHLGFNSFEMRHDDRFAKLQPAISALKQASSLHIFGGGYLNSAIWPDSAFLLGFAAAACQELKIESFATGIGATPLPLSDIEDTSTLAQALAAFKLFECRDVYSFDRLWALSRGRARLICGLDDCFLAEAQGAEEASAGRRLHLCFLPQELRGENRGVLGEIEATAPAFEELVYWNCVPKIADANLAWLRRTFPRLMVVDCYDLVHRPLPVRPGDAMVTQRFHPHLIAARLGCFGWFLQEGKYYADKHNSVLHLGSPFRRYEPGSIRVDGFRLSDEIIARDAEHRARKARVRDACYSH